MSPVANSVIEELGNREIVLLGLGVENQALAHFFLSRGMDLSVCDSKDAENFAALRQEFGGRVKRWYLGEEHLAHLDEFDLAFRSPGIPLLRPELQEAARNGLEISSQTRLFFALSPAPILGVTGTKGKGTTVALIAEILDAGPFDQIRVGGNIGVPPIRFVDELTRRDLVVLELSSFQLQDLDRSPWIAVVLNITEDHLDHHADRKEYVEAKKSICRFQRAGDSLIFNRDCAQAKDFAAASVAQHLEFSVAGEVATGAWIEDGGICLRRPGGSKETICLVEEIQLKGGHNQENAAAAVAATTAAGATAPQIAAGIQRFRGLEHRIESVGEYGGVSFYNDSLATTPDATIAAIQAFDEPLILIAGGSSKGADFAALGAAITARSPKAVILMGEEEQRIASAIARAGGFNGELITDCPSMAKAVAASRSRARPGDVVLLSPGCASFGMFENYKDRGEQFKREVRG